MRHGLQHRLRDFRGSACVVRNVSGHQPGRLSLHDGLPGGGGIVAAQTLLNVFGEMKMLVRQCVRQFVDQRDTLLIAFARALQHEQLLLVVVVKSRGLLRQQVERALAQVVIGRDQPQHLEGQFFGVQVGGLHGLVEALFQIVMELVLGDQSVGHLMSKFQAADLRKSGFDRADVGEQLLGRGRRRNE